MDSPERPADWIVGEMLEHNDIAWSIRMGVPALVCCALFVFTDWWFWRSGALILGVLAILCAISEWDRRRRLNNELRAAMLREGRSLMQPIELRPLRPREE
jgi:hypothetical protein